MQETQEMWVQSLDWEDPLKEEMASHSTIPAWQIPWTEEPGGLVRWITKSWTQLSERITEYFLVKIAQHFMDIIFSTLHNPVTMPPFLFSKPYLDINPITHSQNAI